MSDPWKPQVGKPAMVIPCCDVNSGDIMIDGCSRWINASALHPLPPALIPEAAAALAAVLEWLAFDETLGRTVHSIAECGLLETAKAYRGAIAPKPVDPMERARLAGEALIAALPVDNDYLSKLREEFRAAIAAARPAP